MDKKTHTILDKIASSSAKTIAEAANRSLVQESSPKDPSMGHRTHRMNVRNRLYRRRLGDLDP